MTAESQRDQPKAAPDDEYKVGPGRPPKEHQFKKGQSGNPKGAKRKTSSLDLILKTLLTRSSSERSRSRKERRSARLHFWRRASSNSSTSTSKETVMPARTFSQLRNKLVLICEVLKRNRLQRRTKQRMNQLRNTIKNSAGNVLALYPMRSLRRPSS